MGTWAENLRERVWMNSGTGNGHRLSRKELCRQIGMSEHTYREVVSGKHTNLTNYLRVIITCIDYLPPKEKELAEKEFLQLLRCCLSNHLATEPPYIV